MAPALAKIDPRLMHKQDIYAFDYIEYPHKSFWSQEFSGADKENGSLYIYPGSHQEDLLEADPVISQREPLGANPGNSMLLPIGCAKLKKRTADIPADEPKRIAGEEKLRIFRDGWANLVTIVQELVHCKVKS